MKCSNLLPKHTKIQIHENHFTTQTDKRENTKFQKTQHFTNWKGWVPTAFVILSKTVSFNPSLFQHEPSTPCPLSAYKNNKSNVMCCHSLVGSQPLCLHPLLFKQKRCNQCMTFSFLKHVNKVNRDLDEYNLLMYKTYN